MKTGKKILAILLILILAMSVVPAFAEEATTHYISKPGLAMDYDLPLEDTVIDDGFFINTGGLYLRDSDKFSGCLDKLAALGYTFTGTIQFGDKTITLTNVALNNGNQVYFTTAFPTNGEFAQAMVASDKDYLWRDENDVIACTIDNNTTAKYYNKDKSQTTDLIVTNAYKYNIIMYASELMGKEEPASATQINLYTPYTLVASDSVRIKVDTSIPEKSFFVSTAQTDTFFNDDFKGAWKNNGNAWCTYEKSNTGLDGPYAVYVAPCTGEYEVYCYMRGQQSTTPSTREIYANIGGTDMHFKETQAPDAASDNSRYFEPSVGKVSISLTKGEKFAIRMLQETGAWSKATYFLFTPAGSAVTPQIGKYGTSATASMIIEESSLELSETPVTVTVNGASVDVVAGDMYKYVANASMYDLNGDLIEQQPTVLDAIIAADEADTTYEFKADSVSSEMTLSGGSFVNGRFAGYTVKVNGVVCTTIDRTLLNVNDVIEVKAIENADKTNFQPVRLGSILDASGSIGTGDVLYTTGLQTTGSKFNMVGLVSEFSTVGYDITQNEALADTYLNGYVTMGVDQEGTSGNEQEAVILVHDFKISHSAGDNSKMQLTGENGEVVLGGGELNPQIVSGLEYKNSIGGGQVQDDKTFGFDFSNLYITNSESKANLTIEKRDEGNGVYTLFTNKSHPVKIVTVTYADDKYETIVSTETKYVILDFTNYAGEQITVEENQKVFIWEGTRVKNQTTMKPIMAPLTYK